jgi:hypothetical protein
MRVLNERRLYNADEDRLTEQVVYFDNGCVVRHTKDAKGKVTQKQILVRLLYADDELLDELLALIQAKTAGG